MKRKCFISFKSQDMEYKRFIQSELGVNMIDKSLNEPINSNDPDYIMSRIRSDYLSDSTVTIHLIGAYSAEKLGDVQQYIKRELQASLYDGNDNTRNGVLGVVLPDVTDKIFKGKYLCSTCGKNHNLVCINNDTVVREFSYNYYLPTSKCSWSEDDRYCVLARWNEFCDAPEKYIEQAFQKRTAPISSKVKVYPKQEMNG